MIIKNTSVYEQCNSSEGTYRIARFRLYNEFDTRLNNS